MTSVKWRPLSWLDGAEGAAAGAAAGGGEVCRSAEEMLPSDSSGLDLNQLRNRNVEEETVKVLKQRMDLIEVVLAGISKWARTSCV